MAGSSTEYITLGKGQLAFAKKLTASTWEDFIAMGNCPEITTSVEVETLDHFSSQYNVRRLDKSVVLSVAPSMKVKCDEISSRNMIFQTLGNGTLVEQAAEASGTFSFTAVNKGGYYALPDRFITSCVVTGKTAGIDYILLADAGYIYIPVTSTIADGAACAGTYVAAAGDYTEIEMYQNTAFEGKLLYIAQPPTGMKPLYMEFPSVTLKPDGDMGFIADEWLSMGFVISLQADSTGSFGKLRIGEIA